MNIGRKQVGNILIFVGVLAWLPYFYLLAEGRAPSFLPFLAVHLTGVLSGGWLRTKDQAVDKGQGALRKTIARILILLGVIAWAPYIYMTRVLEVDQAIGPFLAAHLTGVLGGSAVRLSIEVEKLLKRS